MMNSLGFSPYPVRKFYAKFHSRHVLSCNEVQLSNSQRQVLRMSEDQPQQQYHHYEGEGESHTVRNVLMGVVAVYIIFSLYFSYSLNDRINTLESKQTLAEQKFDRKISAAQLEIANSSADLNKQ